MNPEALEIILRLQGVPTYVAGMQAASAANKEFTASQARAAEMSDAVAAKQAKAASGIALVNKAAKAGGLALAAAAVEGFKWSTEFNKQLEMVHTQAGATQKEVDSFKVSLLHLAESGQVTQMPKELAEGLYHLVSIGLRGKQALDALRIAAEGATVGNAHLEDTASALGAAWIVNVRGAGDLKNVMGILNATVGAGNLRMNELVESLGSGILPVAKVAHLSIQDIGAAMATLSDSGYSASSGMAQLGTALHFLYDPTTKARKALESIGLTQRQLFEELSGSGGLHGALALLKHGLESVGGPAEQAEKVGEILPGGRGKVLLTLIEELERLENKKKQIIANSGQFDDAVKRSMEQPANKIAAAWSKFHAVLIEFGEAVEGPGTAAIAVMLVVLEELLKLVLLLTDHGKLLVPVVLAIGGAWLAYKLAIAAAAVATWAWDAAETAAIVALYGMDAALGVVTAAQWLFNVAMDANPIGLIVIAIAAVVAGLVMLILHWREVSNFLRGPWGTAVLLAITMLMPWVGIPLIIATHWKELMHILSDAVNWIGKAWGKLGGILAWPFEHMYKAAKWAVEHAKKLLNAPHNLVSSIPVIGGPLSELVPSFASGGIMPYSGVAVVGEQGPETIYLPGGSQVVPGIGGFSPGLGEPWAHTPMAVGGQGDTVINLDAWLELPTGAGRTLYQLITREVAVHGARS